MLRRLFKTCLEQKGHQVIEATHVLQVYNLLSKPSETFDLAVIDLLMPRPETTTLISSIWIENPMTSVVLIFSDAFELYHLPGVTSLAKPFATEELLSRVEQVLAARA
ncbi:hypothetical protein ABS71_02385 [bacterium SCN 62-11]|nr:hypothetical protein [Candidatus Eremiobacteraeota bacterium]ODT77740.1 MAG: hypothetical protein ABS71_02385 [bacterium SCN 62-11]